MKDFEPFATFRRECLPCHAGIPLGAYGGETLKPIDVCSDCEEVALLVRPRPSHSLKRLASFDKKKGAVNGKRCELSKSQAYPKKFGLAVAQVYKTIRKKQVVRVKFPSWAKDLGLAGA